MMSPAFFEPIFDPFITLASFIFQSSQIASRTNKGLKYQAKTKPVDEGNFTIANLLGTEDCGFVVCDICRGESGVHFKEFSKTKRSSTRPRLVTPQAGVLATIHIIATEIPLQLHIIVLWQLKPKWISFCLFSNRRDQEDDKAGVIGEES